MRLTDYERKAGGWSDNNGRLGVLVGKEWCEDTITLQNRLDITNEQLSSVIGIPAVTLSKVKSFWRDPVSVRGAVP